MSNNTTNINVGYTGIKKDNYMGTSIDIVPNEGEIESEDLFIDIHKAFLKDQSIKAGLSIDYYYNKSEETNDEGLGIYLLLIIVKT